MDKIDEDLDTLTKIRQLLYYRILRIVESSEREIDQFQQWN